MVVVVEGGERLEILLENNCASWVHFLPLLYIPLNVPFSENTENMPTATVGRMESFGDSENNHLALKHFYSVQRELIIIQS